MPHLIRLDHSSIPVGDIDQAVVFYRDVLGLTPIERPDFGFPGAWFDGGDVALHLTTGGMLRGTDAEVRPNEAHLAFRVDDAGAMVAQLAEHDVSVWELPNSPAAKRQIFFNDPWVNMLEMIVY